MTQEALRQELGRRGSSPVDGSGVKRPPRPRPPGDGGALSLDKAWHGVHYLLCGAVEPDETLLSQAVLGGTELGEDFSGYGAARFFEPPQVIALADALADPAVEPAAEARFDKERMVELRIYPFGWEDDDLDWLLSSLRDLQRFYREAAARGCAIATCLE